MLVPTLERDAARTEDGANGLPNPFFTPFSATFLSSFLTPFFATFLSALFEKALLDSVEKDVRKPLAPGAHQVPRKRSATRTVTSGKLAGRRSRIARRPAA